MADSDNDFVDFNDASEPEEDPPEEGAPLWVLTFGDMMSLLLCFFVLMFSMSEVKVERFLIAADSLRSGLGHGASRMTEGGGIGGQSVVNTDVLATDPAPYDITIAMEDVDDFLELIGTRLETFVTQSGLRDAIDVEQNEEGVTVSIQELVLFDTGSAELHAGSRRLMENLGGIVTEFDMPVVVSGHTDDRPIRTFLFPSNWELSSARAASVARIFLEQGFSPARVHIEGYAEFRPVADNETEEGRAKNRRVEILYTRDDVISQMIEIRRQEIERDESGPAQIDLAPTANDGALEPPSP